MARDPSDYRDFQRYFEMLQAYASPDEIHAFLREVGSLDKVRERWRELDALLAKQRAREAIWRFLRTVVVYFAAFVGFLATVRALVPDGMLPW